MDALSPLKVLGRGYAMVTDDRGGLVKTVADTKAGERLDVALGDGKLSCRVEEVIG